MEICKDGCHRIVNEKEYETVYKQQGYQVVGTLAAEDDATEKVVRPKRGRG